MSRPQTIDANGAPVTASDRVKVLALPRSALERLPSGEERKLVQSLVGETLQVGEVDSRGVAWVFREFRLSDGRVWLQKLGLSPREMSKVS
jgi:hypothetical protein